jgi:hypothetical protein
MQHSCSIGSARPLPKYESSFSAPRWLQASHVLEWSVSIPSFWATSPANDFPGAFCWAFLPDWWQNASQACTGPDTATRVHGGDQRMFSPTSSLLVLCRPSERALACLKGWLGVASSSGVASRAISPIVLLGVFGAE